MATKRIEFTKPDFYPDDSLWRNTTTGLRRASDPPPAGTEYAWQDKNAHLDSVGYYPEWNPAGGSAYDTYAKYMLGGSGIDFSSQYDALASARSEAEQAQRTRTDSAVSQIAAQQDAIKQTASQSATQAYINREKALRQMPQQNAYLGLSGGASETALLGLNTGYENSRNDIMRDRDNQIAANVQQQNQVRSAGDAALSDIASAYSQQNLSLLQQQAAAEQSYAQMVYQAQLQQQQWEQQQAAALEQYNRERQDYLTDVTSQREWTQQQTEAERAYQQALARQKNSGSGSSGGMTDKQMAGSYLSWYELTGDPAYLNAYNSMAGIGGGTSSSTTSGASSSRVSMLNDWYSKLSPTEFNLQVKSAISRGYITQADVDAWSNS